ncbi:MAG: flagellar filament capping protein FliD [Lachnospiraceae bacterium]|nr:flagellar filament capping protein FliD [Lachnospiraceae bacterium]MDE7008833.1 flagellar filament capping protein FliD [Lachnospiraceae bacterium]
MPMRVTGMMSGLDTETIIQELVSAKQIKVDKLKKEQTRLEWKQDVWKELNSKIYKLYKGTLDNLVYQSSYMKKRTNVSNSNLVSVSTKDNAMDSVQELEINKMAKAGYLTGGTITDKDGKRVTSGSKLVDTLGIAAGSKLEIAVGNKKVDITVDENMTINNLVDKLQSAGVKANFDATNQRLYIGSTGTGKAKDFTITASNGDGADALKKLGLAVYDDDAKAAYQKYADLASDPAKRGEAVQARIEALIKSYTAERDSLVKRVENLTKNQESLVEAYKKEFGESVDITDDTDRKNRIDSLKADVEQWKKDLEAENSPLTDADKEALKEKIVKAESELSYLEGYDTNKKALEESNARITELNSADYLNVDADGKAGTPGAKLTQEADDYVQGKIDQALAELAGWDTNKGNATKIAGQDAEILLNGAIYTSDKNTFEVNGLTITCKGETNGEKITLTTENDVSGIYDMIKNFIKEYSSVINEMDKLYNAESAKGYEPLTDEEKDSMSDTEVEKWEKKIKDSLLRRDSTLSSVSSAMKQIMLSGFSVNGKNMYLSDFGIETLGYFNAADNEKNAYHINGDEDEDLLKNKDNTLMDMIQTDPDSVISFFTQLSQSLHGKMQDLMGRTDYSSINTVYDDKKMKEDYDSYKSKIADAEKKLQAYEDKWYKKFSAMETALAKMQSNANAVTSLLGG